MCVKLPPGDLNLGPCPPHSANTYTYGVTITPRVCGNENSPLLTRFLYGLKIFSLMKGNFI